MGVTKIKSNRIDGLKPINQEQPEVKGIKPNSSTLTAEQKSSVSPDKIEEAQFSELKRREFLTSIDKYV